MLTRALICTDIYYKTKLFSCSHNLEPLLMLWSNADYIYMATFWPYMHFLVKKQFWINRSDISFNVRGDFSSEIENILFDILLPKTKPILIGILYQPPEQSKFLDNLSTSISQKCSFNEQEVYILGDLNINLIARNILQTESNDTKNSAHYMGLNNWLLYQPALLKTRSYWIMFWLTPLTEFRNSES